MEEMNMNVPFEGEFRFGTDGTMDAVQHFYDPEQKAPPAPPSADPLFAVFGAPDGRVEINGETAIIHIAPQWNTPEKIRLVKTAFGLTAENGVSSVFITTE
jgi:hypothetical protein